MDITDLNPEKNRSEIELRAAVDACIKYYNVERHHYKTSGPCLAFGL